MNSLSLLSPENGVMLQVAVAVGAVLLVQTILVLWAARRLDELASIRERVSRLADGLALLTDTTEAGLATIARELQQQHAARASGPKASRANVSRRVMAAVRKGENLTSIAGQEALSESEVRLHLKLAQNRQRDAGADVASGL